MAVLCRLTGPKRESCGGINHEERKSSWPHAEGDLFFLTSDLPTAEELEGSGCGARAVSGAWRLLATGDLAPGATVRSI